MIRIWLVAAGIACGVLVMSVGSTQLAGMRAQIAALPGMAWLKAEAAQAPRQLMQSGMPIMTTKVRSSLAINRSQRPASTSERLSRAFSAAAARSPAW